jgi:predicted HNH restriction endonuclease
MADVVNLIFGSHCERILARASEDWAVGLPHLVRKRLRSQSVPLLELAQESAGIATQDNSEVSLVRFEPNTDEDVQEASEGRLLTRRHLARERNRKLVETKRKQALEIYGKLTCEVCDFDFSASYGDRGHGFLECHHTKPISTLADGYSTHINDLVLVCANCHRMLHRTVPWLSISELKAMLSPKACKRSKSAAALSR